MTQDTRHLLQSVSKSLTGALAGALVGSGTLDPGGLVTDYCPCSGAPPSRARPCVTSST